MSRSRATPDKIIPSAFINYLKTRYISVIFKINPCIAAILFNKLGQVNNTGAGDRRIVIGLIGNRGSAGWTDLRPKELERVWTGSTF
jgi:hypothetical protein